MFGIGVWFCFFSPAEFYTFSMLSLEGAAASRGTESSFRTVLPHRPLLLLADFCSVLFCFEDRALLRNSGRPRTCLNSPSSPQWPCTHSLKSAGVIGLGHHTQLCVCVPNTRTSHQTLQLQSQPQGLRSFLHTLGEAGWR